MIKEINKNIKIEQKLPRRKHSVGKSCKMNFISMNYDSFFFSFLNSVANSFSILALNQVKFVVAITPHVIDSHRNSAGFAK